MTDIRIRQAVLDDAAAITSIYNQAVKHTTATFDIEIERVSKRVAWLRSHDDPRHPVLVAEFDGAVVGWASLSAWSDRCAYAGSVEISTYVDEAFRGRGIGGLLAQAVVEAGRLAGVHAVLSRICTENEASLRMARKQGFREVGVLHEVGCKFGRRLDVMMLERLL